MTTIPGRFLAVALAVFIAVIALEDLLRTDLSATEHWISHLSLGDHGWVNIADLVFGGLTVLLLAPLVRRHSTSRWPSRWVAVAGVGLVIAGLFVSDAPPGTRYIEAVTWHGQVHDLGGGLAFLGLVVGAVTTRHLVSRGWGWVAGVTVATAWIVASVLAGIGYADDSANLPSGLAERIAMLAGIAWLAALAVRLDRTTVDNDRTTFEKESA
ncbi:MAG TPA: DUF998 domain-containing protein [Jiangellaceae bacterium]